ncbi:hypothetical protein L1987_25223 [Smallanthus sonchifolius]|uniref:Uncharacterized protein n=1 Tax=Smallanthus sonchifolius TaxID=185202 RepID=A0ACB9IN66_9ASTR|nr:hypothetical protein L1987_25223 [Smallanthus sonchifolius]
MVINIIFCLSVILPIFQIKYELLNLLKDSFLCIFRYNSYLHHHESDSFPVDLPIIRFQDLQERRHREVEEMCFICSANYEGDDVVCQLSRCGHVFHSECVGNLIHQKQAHCPFCRASFFSGRPSVPLTVFSLISGEDPESSKRKTIGTTLCATGYGKVRESDSASESVWDRERMRLSEMEFRGKSEMSESKVLRWKSFISIRESKGLRWKRFISIRDH